VWFDVSDKSACIKPLEVMFGGENMGTNVTWYGHATLGLETGGVRILVDPFFTGNPAASTRADAVAADYILVSHGHGDHVGDTVAIAKRTGATVISNFEIAAWLEKQGVNVERVEISVIES